MTVRPERPELSKPLGDELGQPLHLVVQLGALRDVARERVLGRDRDLLARELEVARIDASGAIAQ